MPHAVYMPQFVGTNILHYEFACWVSTYIQPPVNHQFINGLTFRRSGVADTMKVQLRVIVRFAGGPYPDSNLSGLGIQLE